jgi:acylphosphatase
MSRFERRRIFYSGNVQGVGFRLTAQRIAGHFTISGWVRNLPDGRVETVVEGTDREIEAFLAGLGEAMQGNIESIEQHTESATGEFRGFKIAH